jgi:ATP-dependent Clp protease ATP-binding subunit ClpA
MSDGERNKLLTLSAMLMRSVVGQEEAVRSLVNALKRARLDIDTGRRPLGTFLFLGSTGVGKTETAKTLAEHYFGSAESFTRIDLNEYSTPESVNGILGTTDTNGVFHEGFLIQRIQDRPFSLILLDEIEKAHPHVLNLFLQVLDEGTLIDARGLKTDFRNTIIIATSNAGGLYIRDALKENPGIDRAAFKQLLVDRILKDKLFSPEFLNRFDDVLVYFPLQPHHVARLTILMLDHIVRDMNEKRGIRISVEQDVVDVLAHKGYSVEFGARQLRRTITETIENYIADYMLKHTVKRGDEINIRAVDIQAMEQ